MTDRALRWLRRSSQGAFLLLLVFLLVESRLPQNAFVQYSEVMAGETDLRLGYPVTFFFQLDPLVWLSSLLSARIWIAGFGWALGILFLTLVLGRVFCGFVCPLGTLHHLAGAIRPALRGEERLRANRTMPSRNIKYFLLITLITGAVLGLNQAGLLDPIAFLVRSLALAVFPALGEGLRGLFGAMAESDFHGLRLLSYGGEVLVAPVFGYAPRAYATAWFIGGLFLGLLFLNRIRPRFWCRVLCPLGALLGLFSRFSLLHLEQDAERCTGCGRCTAACQGAASPQPGTPWQNSECLLCFNCTSTCPEGALAFRRRRARKAVVFPDPGRRAVLGGLAAGVALPLLGPLDGRLDKVVEPRLIRPPGAKPEKAFLRLCQRCGLCMKVCPTNAVQPALWEAGMSGFWSPRLDMQQGYCEYTCTLCTSICPTGALQVLSGREKTGRPVKIGSAYVDRGRCLPWSGNGPCIVCQEHCPTSPKAIYLEERPAPGTPPGRIQVPFVDLRQCVGCGICENKCPVRGRPAIQVISAGESRSLRSRILL